MQSISERFFELVDPMVLMGCVTRDFDNSRKSFEKACPRNHLRLLAARIHVEGDETTTSTAFAVGGKLTVAKMELFECLMENGSTVMEYVPLLTFVGGAEQQKLSTNPSLKLVFRHIEKTARNGSRRVSRPKTDIS